MKEEKIENLEKIKFASRAVRKKEKKRKEYAIEEFSIKGKSLEDLIELEKENYKNLIPYFNSRARRSLKRGFSELKLKIISKLKIKDKIKTRSGDLIILPSFVNKVIEIYNGKKYIPLLITEKMIGKYLGEFVLTRLRPKHSKTGIGATKSSKGRKMAKG